MTESYPFTTLTFIEYVYGDGVSIIEWPQLILEILPDKRYDVTISKNLEVHTDFREITIEKRGD